MTIALFGVDADSVQRHCFPHLNSFSDDTGPSIETVEEKITAMAGRVAGLLLTQGVTASTIGVTSAAYAQCADVIRKMVAIAIVPGMTGVDSEMAKAWQREVDEWLKRLDSDGAVALGDASLATGAGANGPSTHIQYFSLSEPSTADASTLEPFFRKGDVL